MNYHFAKKPYQYTERVVKVDLRTQFLEAEYHQLVTGDEIEHNGFHNIINQDIEYVMRKILQDLNFLLQVRDKQFWDHLRTQQELALMLIQTLSGKTRFKNCLDSCLIVFSRLEYYKYSQIKFTPQSQQILMKGKDKTNQSQSDQSHYQQDDGLVWYELKKVVLFIFYRISHAQTTEQRQFVFDNWFLDTCKLLDICLIYGLYNPQIVRKIISNVFSINVYYQEDFLYCVTVLRTRFQQICEELKDYTIDLEQISRSQATLRKYQNPSKNFIQRLMKTLFGVYDVCLNIQSIYNYFPYQHKIQVLKHTLIFKRLILIYNKIRYHAEFKWKFAEHRKMLQDVLNLIYKKIIHLLQISIMHIISQFQKEDNPHLYELKKTYINICYFIAQQPAISWEDRDNPQKKKRYGKYCQQLVKNIILVDPSKVLFSKGLKKLFAPNQNSIRFLLTMSKFQYNFFKKQVRTQKQFRKRQQRYKWKHLKKQLSDYFIQQNKINLLKQQKMRIQMKQYQDEPIQQQEERSYQQTSEKINLTDTHTREHHLETDISKISKDLFKKSKDQSGRHNQSDYFGKRQEPFGQKFHWDTNSQFELSSINANEEEYYLLEDLEDFELFDNNSDTSEENTIFTQFSGLKNDFPQFL